MQDLQEIYKLENEKYILTLSEDILLITKGNFIVELKRKCNGYNDYVSTHFYKKMGTAENKFVKLAKEFNIQLITT